MRHRVLGKSATQKVGHSWQDLRRLILLTGAALKLEKLAAFLLLSPLQLLRIGRTSLRHGGTFQSPPIRTRTARLLLRVLGKFAVAA